VSAKKDQQTLENEIALLRQKLSEAEDILRVIRVQEQIFTSKDADYLYRILVETMNEGALTLSHDGTILYSNNQFADLVQYSIAAVVGSSIYQYIPADETATIKRMLRKKLIKGIQLELTLNSKDDSIRRVFFSMRSLLLEKGHWVCGIIVTDITHYKEIEYRIQYLATHDQLTGLPNRLNLMNKISCALETVKDQAVLSAIILINVDKFNDINDAFGREVGDKILQITTKRLLHKFNSADTLIGRIAGDEFIIFVSDVNARQIIKTMTENILRTFRSPYIFDEYNIQITVSMGISLFPENGNTAEELLRAANFALQCAKKDGPKSVFFCTPQLIHSENSRILLEEELKRALIHNEFHCYYQPKMNLKTGTISGLEVLIRWHREDGKTILPSEFIPIAEKTGLINPIGEWVLENACKNYAKWSLAGIQVPHISVNLSAVQLRQVDIVDRVQEVFRETKVDPQNFEFELTESILIGNIPVVTEALAGFKKLNIRLSIDDFGMGYSSFGYLKRFKIDTLKIDQSFITNIGRDKNSESIILAIISLGHSLELSIVAEGVASKAQVEFLRKHKCDFIQGFYVGSALPYAEMTTYLEKFSDRKTR